MKARSKSAGEITKKACIIRGIVTALRSISVLTVQAHEKWRANYNKVVAAQSQAG